ncbi:MAG TPA: hypothetical protein DDY49_12465 [Paenibacillaceae bacterium]|nr:hypothetical protein [Paenibacillaceae bacterium]
MKRITILSIGFIYLVLMMVTGCGTPNDTGQQSTQRIQSKAMGKDSALTNRIQTIAQKVNGVKKANVSVNGVTVLVGIEADQKSARNKRDIELDVYHALKKTETHNNIYVTTDPRLNQRIQSPSAPNGAGIMSTRTTDVDGIIQDIGKQFVIPTP